MRRTHINNITPGMVLGKSIFGENYEVLLKKGVVLTDALIDKLKQRGYICIFIEDEETKDIVIEDSISEKIRIMATKDVVKAYDAAKHAVNKTSDMQKRTFGSIMERIKTDKIRKSFLESLEFRQLSHNIGLFLNEIINKNVLLGLNTIKSFNNYVYEHSVDTAIISLVIAKRLHLDEKKLAQIAVGEFLHDIGHIFIDDKIVQKTGKLATEEYELIKQHTRFGYELLKDVEDIGVVTAHIAYQHHERQDGNGYPRGLIGTNKLEYYGTSYSYSDEEKFIMPAEIAALADFYDACISDRPYRPAWPHDLVYNLIKDGAGTQFNSEIVKCFLSVTPKYPVGTEVRIKNGKYTNFTGIVLSLNTHDLLKPKVKLFCDSNKKKIKPVVIDLSSESEEIDMQCLF